MSKIEVGKTYKTRGGLPVRVICVDRQAGDDEPVVALVKHMSGEDIFTFSESGEYCNNETSLFDLVEVNPWDDVAVDTKVFVRGLVGWCNRHFAHYDVETGLVHTFKDGATSFSTGIVNTVGWREAKLADIAH